MSLESPGAKQFFKPPEQGYAVGQAPPMVAPGWGSAVVAVRRMHTRIAPAAIRKSAEVRRTADFVRTISDP